MNHIYKLIMWDMDGTLADTSKGVINAVKYAAEKMSLPRLPEEIYRKFIGPPNMETYSKYYGLSGRDLEQTIKYHREYAVTKGAAEVEIYKDMAELLKYIRSQKIVQGIITLKAQKSAEEVAKNLKIADMVDFIIGSTLKTPSKTQLISQCMKMFHCSKNESVLIGDSIYDQMGANSVGIDFIAVTYGFGFTMDDDIQEPYKFVAHSVLDLVDFFR